jgi:hypothetical protein
LGAKETKPLNHAISPIECKAKEKTTYDADRMHRSALVRLLEFV